MKITLKKKIELSNFLEQIETNRNSEKVIDKLDLIDRKELKFLGTDRN